MEKFTFFFRTASPFSQWHPCQFTIDDVVFTSAEQYMMYKKAELFGDENRMTAILATDQPRDQKKLGRAVTPFDAEKWNEASYQVVYDASKAKFSQNEELLGQLLSTKGTTLVEASPFDTIWGIGLSEKNPKAQNRNTWRGQNRLGEILTKVREELMNAQKHNTP